MTDEEGTCPSHSATSSGVRIWTKQDDATAHVFSMFSFLPHIGEGHDAGNIRLQLTHDSGLGLEAQVQQGIWKLVIRANSLSEVQMKFRMSA